MRKFISTSVLALLVSKNTNVKSLDQQIGQDPEDLIQVDNQDSLTHIEDEGELELDEETESEDEDLEMLA